ncbi:tyrosine-type recombinase/integrase [Corynebacterium sp. A21]|uniref:tyrosine-type recombinase/integrase n=1 Tax=Corynebacterium sp. A21 TaxID=3457318 RepID=UPI003FD3BE08
MTVTMVGPYFDATRGLHIIELTDGYKPNGKPNRTKVSSRSKNECIRKSQERLKEMVNGEWRPGRKPTVAQWMDEWLEEIAPEKRNHRTMANYRGFTANHIVPSIGGRKLNELTPRDIRGMHTDIREKGLSGRTTQQVHALLSRALKDAVREGIIATNPCDQMDRPVAKMQIAKSLSAVEAKAVIQHAANSDDPMATRWIAALLTGARQGELLGLTWDRVNLMEGTIRIDRQLDVMPCTHGCGQRKYDRWPCGRVAASHCPDLIIDFDTGPDDIVQIQQNRVWRSPKTRDSVRIIPIPHALKVALVFHHRETWVENPAGLVWTNPDGSPVGRRSDTNRWKQLLKDAGVGHVKLHGARHTMVSLMLDMGVDPEIIRQIVGHSTITSTRGYMHVDQATKRAALDTLSRELE